MVISASIVWNAYLCLNVPGKSAAVILYWLFFRNSFTTCFPINPFAPIIKTFLANLIKRIGAYLKRLSKKRKNIYFLAKASPSKLTIVKPAIKLAAAGPTYLMKSNTLAAINMYTAPTSHAKT